jgi:hypothetical protein
MHALHGGMGVFVNSGSGQSQIRNSEGDHQILILEFVQPPPYHLSKPTIMQKGGAVMNRRLFQVIGDIFIPEESAGQKARTLPMLSVGRKYPTGVSFKAIFWACMAVTTALLIGRLS